MHNVKQQKINIAQEMLRYWQKKRGTRHMPSRKDIDPTEIPFLLPHIMLIDVTYNPLDFQCRLAGEHIVTWGFDLTGYALSVLKTSIPELKLIWGACTDVVHTSQPKLDKLNYLSPQGIMKRIQYSVLPLSVKEQDQADMLISTVHFFAR